MPGSTTYMNRHSIDLLSQDVHVAQDLIPGALVVVPRLGVEYDNISQNPDSTTGAPAGRG